MLSFRVEDGDAAAIQRWADELGIDLQATTAELPKAYRLLAFDLVVILGDVETGIGAKPREPAARVVRAHDDHVRAGVDGRGRRGHRH